jgi:CheY-like chemotaxis protein
MRKPLILIVEDDEKSRRLLRDVLRVKGYETVETESAEEGLEMARALNPALILMDIRLPGMSGLDALAVLRAQTQTRTIPVVAVTASLMSQQHGKVVAAEFDALQRKPICVSDLLITMEHLLQNKPHLPVAP